jgi:large subunit ribosomal protein L23
MRLGKFIIRPIISEKSVQLTSSQNRYVFLVDRRANKTQVKEEVQKLFNVTVKEVRTTVLPGKKRRIARTRKFMKTAEKKKAIVLLGKDQKIDFIVKE